jgi:hypothetical protein
MRAVVWSLVLVVALAPATIARQPKWYQLYDEAVNHVRNALRTKAPAQDPQWKQAETTLQLAIKNGPASGPRVLQYGQFRPPFFPEYYLGVVYLHTGRPSLAAEQFKLARTRDIDPRQSEFRSIADFEQRAANDVAILASNTTGGATTGRGETTGGGTTGTGTPAGGTTGGGVAVLTARQKFDDLLRRAQEAIAKSDYPDAERHANDAKALNVDNAAADRFLRNITGLRSRDGVEAALKARDGAAARRDLNALIAVAPDSPLLPGLRDRVETLERDVRRAGAERDAMKEFFKGGYQRAISLLNQAEIDVQLSPRGHFYRACSLAAMVAASANPASDPRLPQARKYYAAARPFSPATIETRHISPRILELLKGS